MEIVEGFRGFFEIFKRLICQSTNYDAIANAVTKRHSVQITVLIRWKNGDIGNTLVKYDKRDRSQSRCASQHTIAPCSKEPIAAITPCSLSLALSTLIAYIIRIINCIKCGHPWLMAQFTCCRRPSQAWAS